MLSSSRNCSETVVSPHSCHYSRLNLGWCWTSEMSAFWNCHDDHQRATETSFWTSCGYGLILRNQRRCYCSIRQDDRWYDSRYGGRCKFQYCNCLLNCHKQPAIKVPQLKRFQPTQKWWPSLQIASWGRLLPWVDFLPEFRLLPRIELPAKRDATGGRLISATSIVVTVGRLTTKVCREDDAPPVPSTA